MNTLQIWPFIILKYQENEPVMLLMVLESKGSSPGRQGFKMAVTKKSFCGNIGGGIMEHKFVEMAKDKLQEDTTEPQVKKQFHNKSAAADQSGMICSGEQTILLYQINEKDIAYIKLLVASVKSHKNGTLSASPKGITFSDKTPAYDYYFEMISETAWHYEEKSGFKYQLHLIGGGHCSLALSKIMSTMDFYICLYEERKDLNTFMANDFAQEKIIVGDYGELTTLVPSGKNNFVVVMTFGYRTDNIALHAIINNDYKYIGVLGSRSKMDQLFIEWEKDGISKTQLQKINAPVGLKIKSQTPDEIAVSIAAEIIQVKNSN